MAENILRKLVNNSQMAIDDGVYDVEGNLEKSSKDFLQIIKSHTHATLLTEIKFSSPSLGKIRTLTDPVSIAKQMISGGSKALSILTQPHLFNGSPEYFIKVRQSVDVPLLMKDIMIDKIQIDAAKKIGADYMLLIQSLFDQGHLKEIDEFIDYAHKKGIQVLLEVHTKQEFENALKTLELEPQMIIVFENEPFEIDEAVKAGIPIELGSLKYNSGKNEKTGY